ncbi:MAG: hypothetical protein KIT54_05790 [Phycisphaeraceae bacterium]|nr:hypothetical protein [Phycisphaeraceae bacterium]
MCIMYRWFHVWVGLFAVGIASSVQAQIPEEHGYDAIEINRPTSVGRIVRHFDFEERGVNAFDVPIHWVRAQHDPQVRQRPGFPITNLAKLDYASPASSGFGSVRLDTSGGSASLRLDPGVVPVFPSVRYAVGAMVRVQGLVHARPRLTARLMDESGVAIEGYQASVLAEPGGDGWGTGYQAMLVMLPGAPDSSVSVQIDLELVQPQERAAKGGDAYAIWAQDYSGTAWFDDVVVVQLPNASLRCVRKSNVFLQHERPELRAIIRDLSGDPIEIDLIVRDMDNQVVDHRIESFGMGMREYQWVPNLPRLGWYEAEMVVRVGQTPLLRLSERFVWVPSLDASLSASVSRSGQTGDRVSHHALSDRQMLTQVATSPFDGSEQFDATLELIERGGARSFLAPVVLPKNRAGAEAWSTLAQSIATTQSRLGAQATIVLKMAQDDAPTGPGNEGERILADLAMPDIWDEVLIGLIDRLAEAVKHWHIGPLGNDAIAATPTNARHLLEIAQRLNRLAPGPIVGVAWDGAFDPVGWERQPGGFPWSMTVLAPEHADAAYMRDIVQMIRSLAVEGGVAEGVILLNTLDERVFGRRAGVRRLAEMLLAFWETLEQPEGGLSTPTLEPDIRIGLIEPWHWAQDGTPEPTAAYAALRGISDRLAGLRHVYDFQNIAGVRASVYVPIVARLDGGGGLLVLHPSPDGIDRDFELYLGEGAVRAFDPFGNAMPIMPTEIPELASPTPRVVHRVRVSDMPVFVHGVDTDLLMFLASIRLEPDLLAAIDVEHNTALTMRNPWPGVTSVRARVVWPGGVAGTPVSERAWEITPRLTDLLLEGGQERSTPLGIRFRRSEPAGHKHLGLELDIRGENSARRVRVDVPFRIGLDYLDVTATARRSGGGLVIMAEVRNLGDRPVTLEATAIAPGVARQRAVIAQLAPGSTARRELVLSGASMADAQRVILAVEDVSIGARLNYQVDLP